jgi:hypothetical protein
MTLGLGGPYADHKVLLSHQAREKRFRIGPATSVTEAQITDIPSTGLGRGKPCLLIMRPAGTGGDTDPSMAGVNSGYSRLEVGAVGVAPWQQ